MHLSRFVGVLFVSFHFVCEVDCILKFFNELSHHLSIVTLLILKNNAFYYYVFNVCK